MLWLRIWANPLDTICAGGDGLLGNRGNVEHLWCCKVMVDVVNHHTLHPTSILYTDIKCFNIIICCGWGYGGTLNVNICEGGDWFLGNWGYCWTRVIRYGWVLVVLYGHDWGYNPPHSASHVHIIYMWSISAPFFRCGWGYGLTLILTSVQVEVTFGEIEGTVGQQRQKMQRV